MQAIQPWPFATGYPQTQGFWSHHHRTPQYPLHCAGRGAALDGLVWLQRRQRTGCQWHSRAPALFNTNTAAAASAVVWMFLAWRDNKPSVLGIVTGAVVGLVAVTPAAGFVTPISAMIYRRRGGPHQATPTIALRNKRGAGPEPGCVGLSWDGWHMGRVEPAFSPPLRSTPLDARAFSTGYPNQFATESITGGHNCLRNGNHIHSDEDSVQRVGPFCPGDGRGSRSGY